LFFSRSTIPLSTSWVMARVACSLLVLMLRANPLMLKVSFFSMVSSIICWVRVSFFAWLSKALKIAALNMG